MKIAHQILAWFLLSALTVGSWLVVPEYGSISLVFYLVVSAILIGFCDHKKQEMKQIEGELQ